MRYYDGESAWISEEMYDEPLKTTYRRGSRVRDHYIDERRTRRKTARARSVPSVARKSKEPIRMTLVSNGESNKMLRESIYWRPNEKNAVECGTAGNGVPMFAFSPILKFSNSFDSKPNSSTPENSSSNRGRKPRQSKSRKNARREQSSKRKAKSSERKEQKQASKNRVRDTIEVGIERSVIPSNEPNNPVEKKEPQRRIIYSRDTSPVQTERNVRQISKDPVPLKSPLEAHKQHAASHGGTIYNSVQTIHDPFSTARHVDPSLQRSSSEDTRKTEVRYIARPSPAAQAQSIRHCVSPTISVKPPPPSPMHNLVHAVSNQPPDPAPASPVKRQSLHSLSRVDVTTHKRVKMQNDHSGLSSLQDNQPNACAPPQATVRRVIQQPQIVESVLPLDSAGVLPAAGNTFRPVLSKQSALIRTSHMLSPQRLPGHHVYQTQSTSFAASPTVAWNNRSPPPTPPTPHYHSGPTSSVASRPIKIAPFSKHHTADYLLQLPGDHASTGSESNRAIQTPLKANGGLLEMNQQVIRGGMYHKNAIDVNDSSVECRSIRDSIKSGPAVVEPSSISVIKESKYQPRKSVTRHWIGCCSRPDTASVSSISTVDPCAIRDLHIGNTVGVRKRSDEQSNGTVLSSMTQGSRWVPYSSSHEDHRRPLSQVPVSGHFQATCSMQEPGYLYTNKPMVPRTFLDGLHQLGNKDNVTWYGFEK